MIFKRQRNVARPFLPEAYSPTKTAVMLAISYGGLCLAYIFVSSYMASVLAVSKIQLTELEFWKGITFVIATSAIVFFMASTILRRVADRERELEQNRQALIVAERRALSGVFAAAVAHDINNTLSVFYGGLDELGGGEEPESVRQMRKALDSLQAMTAQLLRASRDNGYSELTECDLAGIVSDAVSFGRIHSRIRHCEIEEKILSPAPGATHPPLLRQMILNLLLNAAEATGGRGRIVVELGRAERTGGYVLNVMDDGPGVPPEYLKRLFHPFFTTKPSGTGLGLLSVKAAAQVHGGSVEYSTSPLGGACFRVMFPARVSG